MSTGLLLSNSLNRELQKYIELKDDKTVLSILDINNLANINEKYGYNDANLKIKQIGNIIKEFCDKNNYIMKGFKLNENGKSDIFAIIINYKNKIDSCIRYMNRLMNKINKLTNETVSIGLSKYNKYEKSYKQWKLRSLDCLKIAKRDQCI